MAEYLGIDLTDPTGKVGALGRGIGVKSKDATNVLTWNAENG